MHTRSTTILNHDYLKGFVRKNRSALRLAVLIYSVPLAEHLMGEEKPDEELMGKRKSSPRLSTTSLDADILRISDFCSSIPVVGNC